MKEEILIGIMLIFVCGFLAQLLAWQLQLPSILLLLVFGFIVGPVTGLVNSDAIFGNLLFPMVSLFVAIIIFEGGLNLKFSELGGNAKVVRNLISIGMLTTWSVTFLSAIFVLNLDRKLAAILGAILVVSGPTVIIPLLKHVQPGRKLTSVIQWEGITIGSVGAIFTVLVFEAIYLSGLQQALSHTIVQILKTAAIGAALGILGALAIKVCFKNNWIPDFLHNPFALTLVMSIYTIANVLQRESGLLAVTVMGIALANQKTVDIQHLIEFKENLRVLFISTLFIILAARMKLENLSRIPLVNGMIFLLILLFVARPLSVFLSTIRSGLNWRERVFLAWIAPRGIVAAAISSYFSLELTKVGYKEADIVLSFTFLIIIGTVVIYGLTCTPLLKLLGLSNAGTRGFLIAGANPVGRSIGAALQKRGYPVLMVDTNRINILASKMQGLCVHHGSILAEEIPCNSIGKLLALTPNDEVNSLAALHFARVFGRAEVYQLAPKMNKNELDEQFSPKYLRGHFLFSRQMTYTYLENLILEGAEIHTTKLTTDFDFQKFLEKYSDTVIPLFLLTENGKITVFAHDNSPLPQPDQMLMCLVSQKTKSGYASWDMLSHK